MNSKWNIMIGVVALAMLVGGSVFLYQKLSPIYAPEPALSSVASKIESSSTAIPSAPPSANASENSAAQEAPESIPAPDFTVYDSAGNPVKLSDFLGKPVVINFWATWCPYCKEEMPDFQKVWSEVSADVQFLMVNATDGMRETQKKAQEYVEQEGYTFPVYYDTAMEASMAYGTDSLPMTVFIDAQGNLVTGAVSMLSEEILRKGISMIMPADDGNAQITPPTSKP